MRKFLVLLILAAMAAGSTWVFMYMSLPEVRLTIPERGTAVRAVYATGVVEPETWAAVAPLEGGRIVSILAFENANVVSGEPLAELDDQEAVAIIEELEARKSYLANEVNRTRDLLARSIVSEKVYEHALSEHREVLAAIAGAKVRRDHLTLRAPLSGVVLRRDGEVGEVVERGQPVFWVGAPRPLQIEAEVDEEDIPLVRPGQIVKIKADAFPSQVLNGAVREITPKGDPINKNFRIHIKLPDDTPLMIGMTTETNIVVEERPLALLVPTSAVRSGKVWTVKESRAVSIPVETGISDYHRTEITGGLDETVSIIAAPPPGLAEGGKVRILGDED